MKPNLFDYEQPDRTVTGTGSLVLNQALKGADWETFLGFVETQRYTQGQTIVRAGDVDRTIFIVGKGRVGGGAMIRGRMLPIASMNEGAVFGEIGFFDGAPRSATIWAETDVELLALTPAAFEKLAAWHPVIARKLLLDLGRVLASRLRRAEART